MKAYSDFIDRIFLHEGLLEKLTPTEPLSYDLLIRLREADDAVLSGGRVIVRPENFALVRGGLLYAIDAIHEAHTFFQDAPGDLGAYWHGVMHRREGDFDNARYWFRRAGELPIAGTLHAEAARVSPLMARQTTWDAYALTGECEQTAHGAEENRAECKALLRVEFDGLLDYCWRKAVA